VSSFFSSSFFGVVGLVCVDALLWGVCLFFCISFFVGVLFFVGVGLFFGGFSLLFLMESLILAQDERWRRA
jgi:hypothetical protein